MSDTQGEQIPVVVLGLGLSALGTVRSLGRAGLHPYIVCPKGDFAGFSRWSRGRVLRIAESSDPASLVDALERASLTRAVLIPCTDTWSQVVSQLPQSPERSFFTSAPNSAVVDILVDKLRFAEAVAKLGVPHPPTLIVDDEQQIDTIALDGYFLKPRHSQLFAQRYHRKALTFDNLDEARQAFRMIAGVGLGAVLQEYIPGPPTAHYFVDGFVDRNGEIAAQFARRRLRMFPLDFGNSTIMESVPLGEVAGATESLSKLLPGIGYRGIFSAEFKRDPRDDLFKILEVNSRPWWYIEFATLCGVDVSLLAYRDALGLDVPRITTYAVGERCVLLPQDVRAYRALRRTNELSLLPWIRSWLGAKAAIFELSDPLPSVSLPLFAARRFARLHGPS
jgi:predicted ATP-grasp superfamily ATP-dependent carboligase